MIFTYIHIHTHAPPHKRPALRSTSALRRAAQAPCAAPHKRPAPRRTSSPRHAAQAPCAAPHKRPAPRRTSGLRRAAQAVRLRGRLGRSRDGGWRLRRARAGAPRSKLRVCVFVARRPRRLPRGFLLFPDREARRGCQSLRKAGNSVTRATGDETKAGPREGGEGAQHLSLGPRIRACPVVQSQRAEYAQTKPRGFQAGCTLGEVQKLWAVGQAAGEWLPGLLQPIPHHVLRAFPALYKPRDGNRNGRALVWQTSDRLCHISKGYNAQDIVRLGMADSISDVLRKELCLFIHRNGLRTQQIGFNVASKSPGAKPINCFALWFRCELRAFLPVVFGG